MARKTDIRLRRSNVLNSVPGSANLSDGELAMNTNTGALYFKKSDNTIITAVDNTIFHIDSDTSNSGANKKIGIGTTSPEGLMHFAASSDYDIVFDNTSQEKFRLRHGTSGLYLTGPDTNTLAFGVDQNHDVSMFNTSGSAYATFDGSTSRVGIGTTSPATALEVAGDITLPSNGQLKFKGTNHYPRIYASSNDLLINLDNGSGSNYTALKIDNVTGNIGIGTTSPAYKLDVVGKIKSSDRVLSNVYQSISSYGMAWKNSAGTDNMFLSNGGNLGIGTTSPEEDLHVVGDIKLTGTLFNGTRDEYTNSNLIRLNQRYTGGAVSGTSYFEANEYQKVVTVTPNGSSENYQVSGQYYVQSGQDIQTVNFVASLRSSTLPDLAWEIFYDQEDTGVRYIEPFLWTKETTTAGFILGFKVLTGSIYGSVTADINIIPRNADDKDNVSINTTVQSEQTTIDTGFTNQSFTLRKSVNNNLHGFGTNPAAGYRVDVNGNLKASALYSDGYIYHTGDTDTHFVFSDDTITVSAGGQESVFKGSGNVGIGTSSPSDKLHLNGAANAATGVTIGNNNSTRLRLYHDDNAGASLLSTDAVGTEQQLRIRSGSFLALDTGGTSERVRIAADGDVGIGTSSPGRKLDVLDSGDVNGEIIKIEGGANYGAVITYHRGTSYSWEAGVGGGSSQDANINASYWGIGERGASGRPARFLIAHTSGNVGIGATPQTSGSTRLRIGGTGDPHIRIEDLDGTNQYVNLGHNNGDSTYVSRNGSSHGTHSFYSYNGTSTNIRLKINSSGAITFNNAFTFPTSIGTSGQILKVPTSGSTLIWADDSGASATATSLTDTDGDTLVQVEESADEDIIRFDVAGSEVAFINSSTFDIAGRLDVARDIRLRGSDSTPNAGVVRLFTDSSNTLKIDTGNDGSNQFSMDSSGNIDVNGTITAVAGDAGTSAYSITSDGGDLVLKAGADDVVLRTGGSGTEGIYFQDGAQNTKMFINAENNRVGINTTSPTYSLHVNGDSNILLKLESTGTDQNARMVFSPSDGDKDWNIGANDNGDFTWYDAQNTRTPVSISLGAAQNSFVINSSGNVSMSQNLTVTGNLTVNGTTTTINTATLDVEDKNITLNYSSGDSSGSADGAGITIQDAVDGSTDATFNWNATNDRWELSHSLNFQDGDPILWGGNSIVQHTGTYTYIGDNSASNSLRLTGGNLGIGKNPSYKLDVSGSINAAYSATNANVIGMHNGSSGEGWIKPFSNGGDFEFNVKYPGGDSDYIFYVNDSTELMRIKESGNVGIGTNSPVQKLDVQDGFIRVQSPDVGGVAPPVITIGQMTNAYQAGMISNVHLSMKTTNNVGNMYWYLNSTTPAMTFLNTGNLGIGTSSPSYKLDVNGTGRFTGAVTMDSTLTFSNTTAANMLNMGNNNIYNVNGIQMADPGPNEGVSWSNTKIFESPDDLTTNSAGNFQVVYGSTRRLTVNNTGIDVNGTITGATNISKLVATTATGGTGTEDGANTWAKIATYSATSNYSDGTFIYNIVTEEQSNSSSGIIAVKVRWHDLSGSSNPGLTLDWIGLSSGTLLDYQSFKLINDGVSDDVELWVNKKQSYGYIEIWEAAYNKETVVSVDYETNSAWQSSTPTGTAVNVTSGPLLFNNKEVIVGDNFANNTDVKIAGDLLLEVASSPTLTLKDTTNNVTFKSYAQDSNAFTGTTSSHNLLIGTNNTEAIRINNSQYVGINQSSPTKRLHVKNSSNDDNNILLVEASGTTTYGVYLKSAFSGQMGRIGALSQSDGGLDGASIAFEDFGRDIAFRTNEGSNNSEKVRILANGSVGIGDTSPSAKLHVVGAVQNASLQDYGIAAFENTNLEGLSIGYDADGNFTYLYSREVGVSSRGLRLNGAIYIDSYDGNVGIGTGTNSLSNKLQVDGFAAIYDGLRLGSAGSGEGIFRYNPGTGNQGIGITTGSLNQGGIKLFVQHPTDGGGVGIGTTTPLAKFQVEEYGIDTTETSTTATTQVAIHTFAATDFRSARFTIQVTNSTDSAYHTTELLLVHDGTTANITEFGTIFTGTAAEATFDADISSGNVRLLATPASTDSMEFKVIAHSVTV